jgi:hypothetical protein
MNYLRCCLINLNKVDTTLINAHSENTSLDPNLTLNQSDEDDEVLIHHT